MTRLTVVPYQSMAIKWSLPGFCALCDGRPVGLVRSGRAVVPRVRCPHCQPETGRAPIPLLILPTRIDLPKDVA